MLPGQGAEALASESPIRVVLVDDHQLFADALTLLLERDDRVAIVGTAPTAEAGIELVVANDAQVGVMDVSMPGIDGVAARAARPDAAPLAPPPRELCPGRLGLEQPHLEPPAVDFDLTHPFATPSL